MSMMGMAARVTVELITHVDELFGNDDFQCARLAMVDSGGVNEDSVDVMMSHVAIGAAIGGGDAPAEPSAVFGAVRCHDETVRREVEPVKVHDNQLLHCGVAVHKGRRVVQAGHMWPGCRTWHVFDYTSRDE